MANRLLSRSATPSPADPLSACIAAAVRNELRNFLPELVEELAKHQQSDVLPASSDSHGGKFLSLKKDVVAATGLSRSTLLRMISRGEFPKPIQISPGRVGFRPEDVDAWLEGKR